MSIFLEICCGSIDDALQAQAGGAQRVELCSALFLGGLTPSIGTMQHARQQLQIPIMAMVRPRGGGFCYTDAEFATMERDAEAMLANGADGIVFGILREDGNIDLPRTRRLCQIAANKQTVFHRAFDVTPDPFRALDDLVELGITRVLTSGQQDTVPGGADLIRRLIEHAGGRIEVLPGGGIKPYNLADVIARTGCTQVHLTAFKTVTDPSTRHYPNVTFGGSLHPPEDSFQMTDAALVRQIAETLRR
ncbi:MAG: copper homeostasis protein CutC [Terriglobales bacterium]